MPKKQACTSEEIADNICTYAICSGTSVASMLKTLHIGHNFIVKLRAGRVPQIDTLLKIADFLGCTVNDLVYKD